MGRSGHICGAVSGALMVAGLVKGGTLPTDKVAKEAAYDLARQVVDAFQARFGSLDCQGLIGVDISTPEGLEQARKQKLFAGCSRYVEGSAQIVIDLIPSIS
jgi:C_GCAxxG_C_C family probable redox protein